MAQLILINGLPGSGKSTLAGRYADTHPLSLGLDVDVVRGLLGAWRARPSDAGVLARRVALAMAAVALGEDRDVVVPQFLLRTAFIDDLDRLAGELGARFVEVVLLDPVEAATTRLARRALGDMTPTQRDAHALLDAGGGIDTLPDLHRRLHTLVGQRPRATVVHPTPDDIDATYRDLLAAIG